MTVLFLFVLLCRDENKGILINGHESGHGYVGFCIRVYANHSWISLCIISILSISYRKDVLIGVLNQIYDKPIKKNRGAHVDS